MSISDLGLTRQIYFKLCFLTWSTCAFSDLIFVAFLINLGIHNSSLDGSHIQTETSEEQDPGKGKEIKIGMNHSSIQGSMPWDTCPILSTFTDLNSFLVIAESKLNN